MSVLDFLSPLVTAATQQAGNYQQSHANAQALERENIIQSMMLARQQRLDQIDAALKGAQTTEAKGRGAEAQRAADAPHLGDPGYNQTMGALKAAELESTVPLEEELDRNRSQLARGNSLATVQAEGQNARDVANIGQSGQDRRQGKQQLFDASQLNRNLAGQLSNKTKEESQVQGGQVIPSFMHFISGLANGGFTPPVASGGLFGDVPNAQPNP